MTMVAPTRRYHVALVDYLPAGFESLNPELATTEPVPEDRKDTVDQGASWWLWRRVWFDHQNLRNERSEAFTALLWGGASTTTVMSRVRPHRVCLLFRLQKPKRCTTPKLLEEVRAIASGSNDLLPGLALPQKSKTILGPGQYRER